MYNIETKQFCFEDAFEAGTIYQSTKLFVRTILISNNPSFLLLQNPKSKLTHEVESLHHVLDLRNKDISELRMQNAFLAQDVEDLPNIRTKVAAQKTRIEDLTIQLERKSEIEQ